VNRPRPLLAAAVLVVAAAALLGWTVVERTIADRDLRASSAALRTENVRLAAAQADVAPRPGEVGAGGSLSAQPTSILRMADLDTQSVRTIDTAVDAGLRGDVSAYDDAVAKFNESNASYAFALEVLRTQVNEVVVGLDPLTR
jgi:hypothetical protein